MSVSRQLLRPTVTPLPAALNFLSWRVPTGEGGGRKRAEKGGKGQGKRGKGRNSLLVLLVLLVTRVTRYSCYSLLVLLVTRYSYQSESIKRALLTSEKILGTSPIDREAPC